MPWKRWGLSGRESQALDVSIAANDLLLDAAPVPAGQFAVFFYGPGQAQLPFGNGFMCVVGPLGRLGVTQTTSAQTMSWLVDYNNPPSSSTQITAGSTWNFQALFRDSPAGGAFFNTSNATSITFGP